MRAREKGIGCRHASTAASEVPSLRYSNGEDIKIFAASMEIMMTELPEANLTKQKGRLQSSAAVSLQGGTKINGTHHPPALLTDMGMRDNARQMSFGEAHIGGLSDTAVIKKLVR